MSQSPDQATSIDTDHPYAEATAHLNKLVRLGHSFSGHEKNCCYLNQRDGQFANASAVSGLDYADDGRCVVRCDWDFDGDIDLWVSNRTAPRVRFLRNEYSADSESKTKQNYVAFKLAGTESNRDAIGARVIIHLGEGQGSTVLSRSVRRGEGFLGQGSSWLHFGLGEKTAISRLEVRWPNGTVEQFSSVQAGSYYTLVEGTGEAKRWAVPETVPQKDVANATLGSSQQNGSHHLLSESAPLPPLEYMTFSGKTADATEAGSGPTLLNLWASWCGPCVKELSEWSKSESDFESLGLNVVALSVDGLDQPDSCDDTASRNLMERIGFNYSAGMASSRLVQLLQLANNMVYQQDHRPLPVPTSLLIDADGRLAAIYKGPVSLDRLKADVKALNTDSQQRMQQSLPFAGRWIAKPGQHRVGKMVTAMWEAGFGDEALALAGRLTDETYRQERIKTLWTNATNLRSDKQKLPMAVEQLRQLLKLQPNHADALMELGVFAAREGNLPKAAELFENAVLHFKPPSAAAHFNFGKALRQLGRNDQAKAQLEKSVAIDPGQAQAQETLGHLYVAEKDFEQAARQFALVRRLDPQNTNHLLNLVSALVQTKELPRAVQLLQEAVNENPKSTTVRAYFAQLLMQVNRIDEAIAEFEKVVELEPKASKVWYQLSQLATQQGQWVKATDSLRQVMKLVPDDPMIESQLAWLLATAPDASARDGEQAIRLGEKAAEATKRSNWRVLDALAAAHAEVGSFDLAVNTQRQAISQLNASDSQNWRNLQLRLELYEQQRPYRIQAASPRSN